MEDLAAYLMEYAESCRSRDPEPDTDSIQWWVDRSHLCHTIPLPTGELITTAQADGRWHCVFYQGEGELGRVYLLGDMDWSDVIEIVDYIARSLKLLMQFAPEAVEDRVRQWHGRTVDYLLDPVHRMKHTVELSSVIQVRRRVQELMQKEDMSCLLLPS